MWLACCSGLITLLPLLLAFIVRLLVNEVLAISEVSPDFLGAGAWAGHPWVSQHIFECGSVLGIEGHHLLKKIFELGSVDIIARFCVSVCLPECCRLSCGNKSVVWVTRMSTGERRPLGDDHEEDDGRGEEVNAGTLIWSAQLDLGSHVGLRTELSLKHTRCVAALNRCCKTKICDFKGEVFVEEEVLRLEVAMSDSLTVHETQTVQDLLEIVASRSFAQATAESHKVEEFTTTD
jgi:hypothetical protein